jgi:mevalonate kinase
MKDAIYSKVILSGEHSVLRGGYAVVVPNKNYHLDYKFLKAREFKLSMSDEVSPYELLFLGLVESAFSLSSSTKDDLLIHAHVSSIVPLGEGLGGSAALSVFVARLFLFAGLLSDDEVFSFAHEIENVFHGQSSGLDVAGCLNDQISLYKKGVKKLISIEPKSLGLVFTIHHTGLKGETKACIDHVEKLRKSDKLLFESLDERMSESSLKVKSSFETGKPLLLIEALNETTEIFNEWQLLNPQIKEQMKMLKIKGALASRLTGSGFGGCLLALWQKGETPSEYSKNIFLDLSESSS